MGTWGAGLYDDDAAGDLKNSLDLVAKAPGDGDRILALLEQLHGTGNGADAESAQFWLVIADQFEKKGIACPRAADTALRVIESGVDLARIKDGGADEKLMEARRKVLDDLAGRLRQPRPAKARPTSGRLPPLVLETGQVFAFPTMEGGAWHPYRLPSKGPFVPDGWGALVVLAIGRAFEWFPWVALAGLAVAPDRMPKLQEAIEGRLLPHLQTNGAGRFIPKQAHAKGLGLVLLGKVELDDARVQPQLSDWPVETAVQFDWSIANGALTASSLPGLAGRTVTLRTLCREGSG